MPGMSRETAPASDHSDGARGQVMRPQRADDRLRHQ
jgi:hypothetical protein